MPWDCLPEHINEPHEWNGYDDDDHFYTRWRKKVKGWFAVGNAVNRSKYKWANWREFPKCVWLRGNGIFRYESSDGHVQGKLEDFISSADGFGFTLSPSIYLSRVQYWCKWHIALQWPLFLHGHYGKWQAYIGFKRDADKVYWLSCYFGRCWK